MTLLLPRLVFGCGNLTGGATRGAALALLAQARSGGIAHFDTAPSYGIGTAEGLVGAAFGDDRDILITAKVGSLRPTRPLLKTVGRRVLRAVRGGSRTPVAYEPNLPGGHLPEPGRFDTAFMAESITLSLARLRRSPVDFLLLHEFHGVPAEAAKFIAAARTRGHAVQIGYANGGVYDPALRATFPPDWAVQAAIDPAMLLRPIPLPDAPTILHTIVKTDAWARTADHRYDAAADKAIATFSRFGDAATLRVLLPYCLAANNLPGAKLVYTSSVAARLNAVLTATAAIDAAHATPDIAARFAAVYASA